VDDWKKSVWKLPVLSGVILAFAYFPFGLLVPNFVAFLPMLLWLDVNPGAPVRDRLRASLFFGMTVHLLVLHWMLFSMLAISWLWSVVYAFIASVFGLGVMASMTLAGWIRHRTGVSFAWILPLSWLPLEWSRSWGDLRTTADHLGHTLSGYPFLIQFADLVGPYGVGAFMLVVNGLLYETVRSWRRKTGRQAAAVLSVLLFAVLAYGGWKWTHPPEAVGHMRVALIQPNISLDMKGDYTTLDEQWEVLSRLTMEAALHEPDLIVWPESARPSRLDHWLEYPQTYAMPDLQHLAVKTGASILSGVEYARVRDPEDFDLYNAALIVHPDGTVDPLWTAKVYLVPFTEGVPYETVLGPLVSGGEGEMRWLGGGFTPGLAAAALPMGDEKVGVLVCYEEFYWDLARSLRNAGAGLQVIITNDAWFGRSVFQTYQANSVRLRAIENRSSFVRVANTGISGFVDPLGRYHGLTGLFVEAVEVHDVPVTSTRTIYDRTGDVVAWAALIGLPVLVLMAYGARQRRSHEREYGRPVVGRLP